MADGIEVRVAGYLDRVEELCGRAFADARRGDPEAWNSLGADGADYAVRPLFVTHDFYDDASEDAVNAASAAVEAESAALVAALAGRWGAPLTAEVDPFFEAHMAGEAVAPMVGELCELGYFGALSLWSRGGRWVGVGVGHMDKEEPMVLFATVSARPFPEPPDAG